MHGANRRATWLAAVAGLALGAQSQGIEHIWVGTGDGVSWADPLNWLPVGAPGVLDLANFDDLGGMVSVLVPTQVAELKIRNSALTLDLNGTTMTLTDRLLVGKGLVGHSAQLTLVNGSITIPNTAIFEDVRVGADAGTTGVVNIGTGTSLSTGGELISGDNGFGQMFVSGGGSASGTVFVMMGDARDSDGTITVDGLGSSLSTADTFVVGNKGDGHLFIQNRATADGRRMTIADETDALNSDATIQSGATLTLIEDVVSGNNGIGSLTIAGGGSLSANLATVGKASGSVGTLLVDGVGSTFTITTDLFIGDSGVGTAMASNGASVSSLRTSLGDNTDGMGSLTIDGAGTTWTTGNMDVPNFGRGTVVVSNGGSLTSTRAKIGDESATIGSVTVSGAGSTWTDNDTIFVGNFGNGTLTVSGGGSVSAFSMNVAFGFGTSGGISVQGAGSSVSLTSALTNGSFGVASLSLSDGGSVSAGTYAQDPDAALNITLSAGGAGQVSSTGPATLGGTLNVTLAPGFDPAGGSWEIITASSVSGAFSTVNLPPDITMTIESTRVVLDGPAGGGCPADIDGDGDADVGDFFAFIIAFSTGDPAADVNGDGVINVLDFFAFVLAFQAGCP